MSSASQRYVMHVALRRMPRTLHVVCCVADTSQRTGMPNAKRKGTEASSDGTDPEDQTVFVLTLCSRTGAPCTLGAPPVHGQAAGRRFSDKPLKAAASALFVPQHADNSYTNPALRGLARRGAA